MTGLVPQTLVHVDMHHDLGRDGESGEARLTCGNVLAKIIAQGHVRTLYWIIPIPKRMLASKTAIDFLGTLPSKINRSLELTSEGRYVGAYCGVELEVRGADDLSIAREQAKIVISYDLDFHYSRCMAGPTLDPVIWLSEASHLFQSDRVEGIFFAHGFVDGYTPSTYRPIAYMLEQWRFDGPPPTWQAEVWDHVCACEKQRLKKDGEKAQYRELHLPDELQRFFEAWTMYMEGDFKTAAALFDSLPPLLRFNPLTEIRVEYQHNIIPSFSMISRVKNSYQYFG